MHDREVPTDGIYALTCQLFCIHPKHNRKIAVTLSDEVDHVLYISLCFTSFVIAHFDRMTDTPAGLAGGGFFIRSSLCDRAA